VYRLITIPEDLEKNTIASEAIDRRGLKQ
jgi:hypothetical protein